MGKQIKSGATFEPLKPGSYRVLIKDVIDIGTQPEPPNSGYKEESKFAIVFQVFARTGAALLSKMGDPVTVEKRYSKKFSKIKGKTPAAMRMLAEAAFGREFSDAEARQGIDAETLIGRPVMATVGVNEGGRNVVLSTAGYADDEPDLKTDLDNTYYDVDPSREIPGEIREYHRGLIESSREWTAVRGGPTPTTAAEPTSREYAEVSAGGGDADDLPF